MDDQLVPIAGLCRLFCCAHRVVLPAANAVRNAYGNDAKDQSRMASLENVCYREYNPDDT